MNKIRAFFENFDENYDREKIRKILRAISLGIIILILLYYIVFITIKFFGIGIIKTPSIDASIIVFDKRVDATNLKNKIAFFSLPKHTPYFLKDSNFAKYVRCEGGDRLSVKGLSYFCNKEFIGIAKTTDKDGNKIKPFVFNGVIPYGQYFVMGTHERSYDSRYWGFVDYKHIKGVAIWAI